MSITKHAGNNVLQLLKKIFSDRNNKENCEIYITFNSQKIGHVARQMGVDVLVPVFVLAQLELRARDSDGGREVPPRGVFPKVRPMYMLPGEWGFYIHFFRSTNITGLNDVREHCPTFGQIDILLRELGPYQYLMY